VSVLPVVTPEQVPTRPARLQAEQLPSQALSQQTPSTQLPDPHSVPAAQMTPFAFRPDWQVPLPSQYWVPVQVGDEFGSWAPASTLTQLPSLPGTLQPWQVPTHVLLQQMPSTQNPEPQSALPFGHMAPFGFLFI
jgi:hypothetical protein